MQKKLHVGHEIKEYIFQDLAVDKWSEVEIKNEETEEWTTNDVWTGEHIMEEKTAERYLGDVISTNGKNLKNIKARIAKGKGITEAKI